MKPKSKKDEFVITLNNEKQIEKVKLFYCNIKGHWPDSDFAILCNNLSRGSMLYNYIPKEYSHLPVISFEEWESLPDEEFVLPENWHIEVNSENKKTISNWRCSELRVSYGFVNQEGLWMRGLEYYNGNSVEITFEQFKEHVLKEIPKPEYDPKDVAFKPSSIKGCHAFYNTSRDESIIIMKPKKIIGYKLIKPEYLEAVNCICKRESRANKNFLLQNKIFVNSDYYSKIKDAEILHWFEPVYDTSITLKSGVILSEDDIAEVKNLLDTKKAKEILNNK